MEEIERIPRGLLMRMPLAEAAFAMMGQVFSEALLNDVWETHRGRCYDRKLSFPLVVELLQNALFRHKGSGRASFDEALEARRLPVSRTAAYNKLGRIPLATSAGLLRDGSCELQKLVPIGIFANPLPACFDEFHVVVLDGKIIKGVPHLAKLLRGAKAAVLGGKASVLLDARTRLVLDMAVSGDGYADELALTRRLICTKEHGNDLRPTLFILDRLYCNREIPALCLQSGHFVIRFGGNLKFREDPDSPSRRFQDEEGTVITECRGWVNVRHGNPLYVRQITREPRHGKAIRVITDLLDSKRYPGEAVLELYRIRWSIECVFQLVTKTFGLERLVITTPFGSVFQFALCLLLHNVVQVIKLILAEQTNRPVEKISTRKLLEDVQSQTIALYVIFPMHLIVEHFRRTTPRKSTQLLRRLQTTLHGVWRPRWIKEPTKPHRTPTPKRRVKGNIVSAYRIIQDDKKANQRR
jgi:Transposase DDE domain